MTPELDPGCDCPECRPDLHRRVPEAPADVSELTMESAKDPAVDRVGRIIGLVVVLALLGVLLTALLAAALWLVASLGVPVGLIGDAVTLVLAGTFVAFLVTARPRGKR